MKSRLLSGAVSRWLKEPQETAPFNILLFARMLFNSTVVFFSSSADSARTLPVSHSAAQGLLLLIPFIQLCVVRLQRPVRFLHPAAHPVRLYRVIWEMCHADLSCRTFPVFILAHFPSKEGSPTVQQSACRLSCAVSFSSWQSPSCVSTHPQRSLTPEPDSRFPCPLADGNESRQTRAAGSLLLMCRQLQLHAEHVGRDLLQRMVFSDAIAG